MIYLASPYSDPDPEIMEERFLLTEKKVAELLKEWRPVFSPIVHCHALSIKYALPKDFEFWQNYCLHFLSKSDQILVYKLPGWEQSKGIIRELKYAKDNCIQVRYTI